MVIQRSLLRLLFSGRAYLLISVRIQSLFLLYGVRQWQFPKSDADTIVQSFPFLFKGGT